MNNLIVIFARLLSVAVTLIRVLFLLNIELLVSVGDTNWICGAAVSTVNVKLDGAKVQLLLLLQLNMFHL